MTLRAHQELLKAKSDLILKQLVTVNCPFSPIRQQTITSSESTLSSAKTLEASGSESTLDGSGNDIGDDVKSKNGIQDMPGPQVLILVQEIEDDGQSENDDKSTKDSERDQLVEDPKDTAPTTDILALNPVLGVEEHHVVTYLHPGDMDPNQNLIETTGIHLEEIERTAGQMLEILSKHISTNQFSKLISETDDMCFRSQEVFRFEMERRRRWRIEAGLQEEQSSTDNFGQNLETGEDKVVTEAMQAVENNEDTGESDAESTLMSLEEALKEVIVDDSRMDRGRSQRHVDSKDRMSRHPREVESHSKPKYRYRGLPGSSFYPARNSFEAGPQGPLSADILEEHKDNLKDYVSWYLAESFTIMAEMCELNNTRGCVTDSNGAGNV